MVHCLVQIDLIRARSDFCPVADMKGSLSVMLRSIFLEFVQMKSNFSRAIVEKLGGSLYFNYTQRYHQKDNTCQSLLLGCLLKVTNKLCKLFRFKLRQNEHR